MRPARALDFCVGDPPKALLREASAMDNSSAAIFLLGDLGMAHIVMTNSNAVIGRR